MKTMYRFLFGALITVLSVNAASAQNAHLMSPITVTDNGTTLSICYDIAGLGNVSQTKLTVNYSAVVTTECENRGGNIAPGQTKTVNVSENTVVAVSNGRATGCYTTKVLTPGKCPNGNWTGHVTDVTFSALSITVAGKTFTAQ